MKRTILLLVLCMVGVSALDAEAHKRKKFGIKWAHDHVIEDAIKNPRADSIKDGAKSVGNAFDSTAKIQTTGCTKTPITYGKFKKGKKDNPNGAVFGCYTN